MKELASSTILRQRAPAVAMQCEQWTATWPASCAPPTLTPGADTSVPRFRNAAVVCALPASCLAVGLWLWPLVHQPLPAQPLSGCGYFSSLDICVGCTQL